MLNKNSGFTLIEAVVAIFVIALIITGVFTLIQRTVMDRAFAASQLQATYLAQEGVELVRNQRDENWLNGDAWDSIDTSEIPSSVTISGKTFTRGVNIIDGPAPDKITASVTVGWTERGRNGEVKVISELYNWIYW